jgi:site-specific recombinase XerD
VTAITTQHIREFLAYLRDNTIRFGGKSTLSRRPVNRTTIQRYYRVLSVFWNWLLTEEIVNQNPLTRMKTPSPEKKMINGLSIEQVNRLLAVIDKDFNGKRNKALILILVDSGLRLGELLRLRLADVDIEHQLVKVSGKVGERFVRFGSTTARALLSYLMVRNEVNSSDGILWLSSNGQSLSAPSV